MQPHFYLDEGLSEHLAAGLRRFGFLCQSVEREMSDLDIIQRIADEHGHLGVWLPRDLNSKRAYRSRIMNAGISVAWIRDENGSPAKHCFLVYNFMYRYRGLISSTPSPLYFEIRERLTRGVPNAVVRKITL